MPLSRCSCLEIALANLRKITDDPSATISTVVVAEGTDAAKHPAITVRYRPRRKNFIPGKDNRPVTNLPITSFVPPVFCPFCGKRIKTDEKENM